MLRSVSWLGKQFAEHNKVIEFLRCVTKLGQQVYVDTATSDEEKMSSDINTLAD